jgi:hypothetical protein
MKLSIQEVTVKIIIISESERKHPNILANALVTFKGEDGYFTISGFTVWRSKHGGLNATVPENPRSHFKYMQSETGLWRRLKLEIESAYEYALIPVVDG